MAIGGLGLVAGATVGGLADTLSTGMLVGRAAKDATVATQYLQGFQEYMAGLPSLAGTPDGSYCDGPDCTGTSLSTLADLAGYPDPTAITQPFQLDTRLLAVQIDTWWFDDQSTTSADDDTYCATGCVNPDMMAESLVRVETALTWIFKGQPRTLTMNRFLSFQR